MLSQIWQSMRARYGRAFFGYGLLGFMFVALAAMFWQVHVTTPFFAIGVAWSFRMAFARRKMRTVRLRNEELTHLESTKNCGAHLMLQVRTRTLDGTLRRSSSSGIRLKAGARSAEVEPCAA